ncbi:pyruvate kinase [Thiomonas sp.]|jgi:pyruvate kinase|uniref:pyruvate kinase n=1 Tax=Thiomonas intermedia (strain K12) TaxID=75379 RepID=D5X3V5_THIK1|nr:pyruvate kinase [Thiomonas sp.]
MSAVPTPSPPRLLYDAVSELRRAALAYEQAHQDRIDALPPQRRASARNLLHYIAVRQADLRPLQTQLAQIGLSSLGMLETHVLAALDAVLDRLEDLLGHARSQRPAPPCTFAEGLQLLQHNTTALLNPPRPQREVRIMVTLATEAAQDAAGLRALVEAGMDIARINCAHDDAAVWQRMAELVHGTDTSPQRRPLVQIDLAGPKSRTGELLPQGRILHLRPRHDVRGQIIAPALLALWCGEGPPPQAPEGQTLLHAGALHPPLPAQLPPSARLQVTDLRSRARQGRLISREGALLVFAFERSAYLAEGMPFKLTNDSAEMAAGTLQGIAEVPGELRLFVGDPLVLLREERPGHAGQRGDNGAFTTPPQVHCTLDAAFTSAQVGQSVWLDDGRIGAVIETRTDDTLQLRITHAEPSGSRLKAEKGINFPDTRFDLPALTEKDRDDLAAMARHLDLVALSFLRSPQDVRQLRAELSARQRDDAGVVLKIENRQAFDHLPAILLEALAHPRLGVMVARGDLAVELGFERLSEAQEEILWMCEAAHLPVIWATQILDTMARSGLPSRPEVSDAALSIRAECAMLNKGPHIVEAVRFLSGVLERMEGHYAKRMTLRRPLSIAELPS